MQLWMAVLLATLIAAAAHAQEIPLVNPGFEQASAVDATMPEGWTRWQAGPAQIFLDGEAYQGERCAAVVTNPPGRGRVVLRQTFTRYRPGQAYEVVFAGRTNGLTGGRLQVINRSAIERGEGREAIYPGDPVTVTDTDWQQVATTFTAPRQPGDELYLELSHVDADVQGAVVWFDDFSIRPLEEKHTQLQALTRASEQALFAAMVHARWDVGSRAQMLGWFADDAQAADAMDAEQAERVRGTAAELLAAIDREHDARDARRAAVFDVGLPLTRMTDEEIAARSAEVARVAEEGAAALAAVAAELGRRLSAEEERAREVAGEFMIAPSLSADVRPVTLRDRFHRVISWHGFMSDVAYVQRAMLSLDTTLVQAYLSREENRPLRREFLEANQPRTLATVCAVRLEGWPDLTAAKAAIASTVAELGELPGFVGIEVDEPSISDEHASTSEALAQFRQFVRGRYDAAQLRALGVDAVLDEWTPATPIATDPDRVLWMELQQFKGRMLADRLVELQSYLQSLDERLVLLPVVQQFVPSAPQRASWTATGPVLDWIAMDPYNGGSPAEALEMDLLRSTAAGPTLLVVGTCYDPTAGRFAKDMSIALGHADGLWTWCWVYMAQFRAPGYLRDWERDYRGLWKPGMWEAAQEVFGRAAAAEPYLTRTDSAARVSVVYSERSGILASREPFGCFPSALGLYGALAQAHIPQEAVFAESLSADSLAQRDVLLLAEARSLTDGEVATIREWVRGGGTLIAIGATSLLDAWGRERADYALADVFGVRHTGVLDAIEGLTPGEGLRALAGELPETMAVWREAADAVEPTSAQVLATLPGGEPAITRNTFGAGQCYLLTPRGFALSFDGNKGVKGIEKYFWPGVLEVLAALTRSGLSSERIAVSDCPPDVELAVRRQGARLIAHLLNFSDEGPVAGVRLHLRGERPRRVFYADRPEAELELHEEDGGFRAALEPFEHHVMVVVE